MKLNRVPEASIKLHNGCFTEAQRDICGTHVQYY